MKKAYQDDTCSQTNDHCHTRLSLERLQLPAFYVSATFFFYLFFFSVLFFVFAVTFFHDDEMLYGHKHSLKGPKQGHVSPENV